MFACTLIPLLFASAWSIGGRLAITCDLDRDGRTERILLDPAKDPSVSVWRDGQRLWADVRQHWHPYKIAVADLEGNGRSEIIVALNKSTRYLPKRHNCLFVYGFNGSSVYPRWLGSTLGRDFSDFAFANVDGDGKDRLVCLSKRLDGRYALSVYGWNGFGFTKLWERGGWRKARLMGANRESINVQADGKLIKLRRNGR